MALIQVDHYGLKAAIDQIMSLRQLRSSFTSGSSLLPATCITRWENNHFVLDFTTTNNLEMNLAYYQGMRAFTLKMLFEDYEVPERGANVSKWNKTVTSPDVVSLSVSQFKTKGFNEEQHYYLRYITPISKTAWNNIDRGLRGYVYNLGNKQTQTLYPLHLKCSDLQIHHYEVDEDHCFLIIDSLSLVSLEYMEKAAFNILLSLGLLYGEMPLDESYVFVCESKDFTSIQALVYKSLVNTLKNDYSIYTSNVYSVLVPLAIRKDPVNGEHRMCNIIQGRKWFIDEFPLDVFCKLVQNYLDSDALSWGGFYLINACHFTLEMQPGAYSTALETITSEVVSNIIPKGTLNVIDSKYWPTIHTDLDKIVDKYSLNGKITSDNTPKVKAKINSLSGPTNIDKLSKPFGIYGYQLSTDDDAIIRQRNSVLHGAVKASMTIDQAFQQLQNVSLGLHRLCCTLLLKMAGYQGYIINNQRLFGADEKAKPFIWI